MRQEPGVMFINSTARYKKAMLILICLLGIALIGCSPTNKTNEDARSNIPVQETIEALPPQSNNTEEKDIEIVEKVNNGTDAEMKLPKFEPRNLIEFEKKPIQMLMEQAESFAYPDEPFVPLLLLDNHLLLGELTRNDETAIEALSLTTGEYFDLVILEKTDEMRYTNLIAGNSQYVLYTQYLPNQGKLTYYLYNFTSRSTHEIHHVDDVPNLHYNSATFSDDDLFFMSYCGNDEPYNIFHYEISEKKLTTIENKHSLYPVSIGDELFYLRVDYQNHITKLVQESGNVRTIWFQERGNDLYLSGLVSNNRILVLTRTNKEKAELFVFDPNKKQMEYRFETTPTGSISIGHQMITWGSAPTLPGRARLQYHVFDLENNIFYENNGGSVFLNNDSIVWIEYLKDEQDIMKGEVFRNENSIIRFLDLGGHGE